MTSDAAPIAAAADDQLTNEKAVEVGGKVADIERRVEEVVQRASFRRKLTPSITSLCGSHESLDTLESMGRVSAPLLLSPSASLQRSWHQSMSSRSSDCASMSGEEMCEPTKRPRLAVIGGTKPRLALIGPLLHSPDITLSCIAINKASAVLSLPSPVRGGWISASESDNTSVISTSTNADSIHCKLINTLFAVHMLVWFTTICLVLSRE